MPRLNNITMTLPAELIGRAMVGDKFKADFYYRVDHQKDGAILLTPDLVNLRKAVLTFGHNVKTSATVTPQPTGPRGTPLLFGCVEGEIKELMQHPITNVWEIVLLGEFDFLMK